VKSSVPAHDISFRVGLFPIVGQELYCGIFIDTSEEEKAKEHLRNLRAQTLARAQEVISRQMKTAQEIASLLGETTAETKILLVKLMSLFEVEKERSFTMNGAPSSCVNKVRSSAGTASPSAGTPIR
jgi:hypothetical protein